MDRLITIEQSTEGRGSMGGITETWTQFDEVWAKWTPGGGGESFDADQETAERSGIFMIRWLDGLTTKMRIRWDGLTWDIKHIAEIGRREGLNVTVEARGN